MTDTVAPREKRWNSGLALLYAALAAEAASNPTTEADAVLDSGWQWRVLEDGVVIAMRTAELHVGCWRYELRIAADPSLPEWEGRLAGILRELGIRVSDGDRICPFPGALWYRLEAQARDEGKLAARYVSLMTSEITPPERWTTPNE